MANRLLTIIPTIITKYQTGFVRHRYIADNDLVA